MNRSLSNSVKAYTKAVVILAVTVLILSGNSYSQVSPSDITESVNASLNRNAVENLKANISSDNSGVKKSAIYYAGYYRVKETIEPLMKQLTKEKDPATRILIALSLYKLNDSKALDLIRKVSISDPEPKVRRICNSIYSEYSNDNGRVATR